MSREEAFQAGVRALAEARRDEVAWHTHSWGLDRKQPECRDARPEWVKVEQGWRVGMLDWGQRVGSGEASSMQSRSCMGVQGGRCLPWGQNAVGIGA